MSDFWQSRRVCILGGAGFIGRHLAGALVNLAQRVTVADDFSSGSLVNTPSKAAVHWADLRNFNNCLEAIKGSDIVFHLASNIGGRAYLTRNPHNLWGNLELDTAIFRACLERRVEKVVFFSSACVYPKDSWGYMHESDCGEIEKADSVYGMEKLIGERMLADFPLNSVSIRPFTVYGPGMKENRSIGALIAKTFIKQDPFEVWGDGNQVVDWVYVKDVVKGALLVAEKANGAVNIGSGNVRTPMGALSVIWDYVGWKPKEIVFRTDMPSSPARLANNTRIRDLGWNVDTAFECGLRETADWYYKTHRVEYVREHLERKLVER